MGARPATVVISGYYGFGNSGDEAVLQSIVIALRDEADKLGFKIEPIVLSNDPAETSRMYGVRAVHRLKPHHLLRAIWKCDGVISGGGSLLQDVTGIGSIPYYLAVVGMAQWLGKPTFVYSQGIGPVNRKSFYPWIRRVLGRCRYLSVRDEESAELLERMRIERGRIHVVPDPVMGLPLRGARALEGGGSEERPLIGVSVRFWNEDRSELDGLAAALADIRARRDVRIRFLPFHLPSDAEASRYVIGRMGLPADDKNVEIVENAAHPQDMLAEVGACRLLVGMRLHSLIYAASQLVPMIGISYDPKIDQFLRRLRMTAAASTSRFSREAVVAEALKLLDAPDEWRQDKQQAIEALRRQAQEPARQIVSFFRQQRGT
jgi:polysaccharide pyruvyl transferase CsaB